MSVIVITVAGMHCENCARRIEAGLGSVEGVRRVSADVESGRIEVRADDARVSAGGLAERVRLLGFDVTEAHA